MAETAKAKQRRIREGFFEKYCSGKGIDIGCGPDKLSDNCDGWDYVFGNGDATIMEGVADESYDFAYSSHCLEHLSNPGTAIKNWFRIVKPGGYLVIFIPHRDLYEKRKTLPSRYNGDHKYFYLIEQDEEPHTIGILPLIAKSINNYELIYAKKCDAGHTIKDPLVHSNGEYSIEVVLKKRPTQAFSINKTNEEQIAKEIHAAAPFPTVLAIESTSKCDVNPPCVMCIRNLSPKGSDVEDYVLEKLGPYWKYFNNISLHGIGEVMHCKKLERLIEMSRHAYTSFTTGGHLFNDNNIKYIVDNDIDYISISIDAATKQTHDRIRGTGFDNIISGIIKLQEYKFSHGKNNPQLTLNATLMKENINEAADIIKLAHSLDVYHVTFGELAGGYDWKVAKNGFDFNYEEQKTIHNKQLYDHNIAKAYFTAKKLGVTLDYQNIYDKSILLQEMDIDITECKKIVPDTKQFPAKDKTSLQIKQKFWMPNGKMICSRPWKTLWCNGVGELAVCCHQNRYIGSLAKNSFPEIWFGDEMQNLRSVILNNDLPPICKLSTNICKERFESRINLPKEYDNK